MTGPDEASLPSAAWTAALAGLPKMGPVRLAALVTAWGPREAWARVCAGGVERAAEVVGRCRGLDAEVGDGWARAARSIDVAAVWAAHRQAGIAVLAPGDAAWPAGLDDDPDPPAVLFALGRLDALAAPAVALVGTRRCTPTGRAVARDLGAELAAAGVCVLSGLALGIDGAAHRGALAAGGAPPVAVVGTGLDVAYPQAHAGLAAEVAAVGAVLSEYPLGTPPATWRFPARNRVLAALAQVVVVVESAPTGGSMHTVDAALERDRTVLAVPGSVRNPVAAGTNGLLAAGCAPARDATDVLVALGAAAPAPRARSRRAPAAVRPVAPPAAPPAGGGALTADQRAVLDALGWDPTTLEQVADRLDVPLGPVSLHLAELERLGAVERTGAWYTQLERGR